MRVQVLAILLLLLAASAAAAEYYIGGERKIAVTGSVEDMGWWIGVRRDSCLDQPPGFRGEWSERRYTSGGVRYARFLMGLVFDFSVETGIPRVDDINQFAKAAFGQAAAPWAMPQPLVARPHSLDVRVEYSAPSMWGYETTHVYVECRIYNSTSGALVGYWSDRASFVTMFMPMGWESGSISCRWSLSLDSRAAGSCTLSVPWYGKNWVSPGDFGADYWNKGVMPKPEAFGTYRVHVNHQWPKKGDKFSFLLMSGLKRGDVNKNPQKYTKDAKVKPEYLDYVWYITGGEPFVEVRFGPGKASALRAVYEESLLQRWVGDEYYRHGGVPENEPRTYTGIGIPVRYELKIRLLPPLWASVMLTAPRATVPEIRHVLLTLAEVKNEQGYKEKRTFYGLYITGGGYCRIHGLKNSSGWAPAVIRTSSESWWAHWYAAEALGFEGAYPGVKQVIITDTASAKFKNCTAVAYAVVVNVPNGVARTYVDRQPATWSLRDVPWLIPLGGIGRVRLNMDFEFVWLGYVIRPPLLDKGGIEAAGCDRNGIGSDDFVEHISEYLGIRQLPHRFHGVGRGGRRRGAGV